MKEDFLVRKGINIHLLLFIFLVVKAEGFDNECIESNPTNCGWKTNENGRCRWEEQAMDTFAVQQDGGIDEGYAILTKEFRHMDDLNHEGNICISFKNFVQYNGKTEFHVSVNDREPLFVDTASLIGGDEWSHCYEYKNEYLFKVTLNASCEQIRPNSRIENLDVTNMPLVNATPKTTSDANPTEIGDIQYVGVVVGAICIALFTLFSCLTIISARRSNQRDSRRQELQNATCPEEDDRPDAVADNAPPSYDVVMASPNMYPPTPQGTPQGTPETTPYLSLHRRALLNQYGGTSVSGSPQSQRQSITPTIASQWEEERDDPPPPYPGIANGNIGNSTSELNTQHENHDAGTGESTSGESTSTESTSAVSIPQAVPRSGDLNRSDPSSDQDRGNNPWVINHTGNNTREINPRRNNARDENGESDSDVSPDEFALRARTAGNVDGASVEDEEIQRPSVTNDAPVVEQNLTEPIVDNDIHYADSSDNVPKSSINNRSSTISNLALV